MSLIQEQAVQMIEALPDDRVQIIIDVIKGFTQPIKINNSNTQSRRIGIAKGKFIVPDDIDECNDEIAEMFGVDE